jgi:hypothetical protein
MGASTIVVSTDHVSRDSSGGIQCEDEDAVGIREIGVLNWAVCIGGSDRGGVPTKVRKVFQPFGGIVRIEEHKVVIGVSECINEGVWAMLWKFGSVGTVGIALCYCSTSGDGP